MFTFWSHFWKDVQRRGLQRGAPGSPKPQACRAALGLHQPSTGALPRAVPTSRLVRFQPLGSGSRALNPRSCLCGFG